MKNIYALRLAVALALAVAYCAVVPRAAAQSCGLLTNTAFASGAADWTLQNSARVVADRVHLDSAGARLRQVVSGVRGSEAYTVSFERFNRGGTIAAKAAFYAADGSYIADAFRGFWPANAPLDASYTFTTPPGAASMQVSFEAWGNGVDADDMVVRAPCLRLQTYDRLQDFITTTAQRQRTDVDIRAAGELLADATFTVPPASAAARAQFFAYVTGDDAALKAVPSVLLEGLPLALDYRRVSQPGPDGLAVYVADVALEAAPRTIAAAGLPGSVRAAGLVTYGVGTASEATAVDQGGVVYAAYAKTGWSPTIRVPLAPSFEKRDVVVEVPLGLLVADGRELSIEVSGPNHGTKTVTKKWKSGDLTAAGTDVVALEVKNVPSGQSYVDVRVHSPAGAGQTIFLNGPITATNENTTAVSVTSAGLCNGSLGREMFPAGDFGTVTELGGTVGVNYPGITWGPMPPGSVAPGYNYVNDAVVPDGAFGIVTSTDGIYQMSTGSSRDSWIVARDRGDEPDGYAMLVNADHEPGIFFYRQIDNLCEGTDYAFSVSILNVDNPILRPNNPVDPGPPYDEVRILPDIDFVLAPAGSSVQDLESLPAAYSTGPIMNDSLWHDEGFTFTMPDGVSSVVLAIRNNAPGGGGNDILLDDISFKACGPTTIIVNGEDWCTGAALAIDDGVSGSYNKPAYRWEHSRDHGLSWQEVPGGNKATLDASGYVAGDRYRLRVAGSNANIDEPNCYVFSNELVVTNGDCPEVCGNGVDDDLDGLTDCDDPDCATYGDCDCSVAEGLARVEYYLELDGHGLAELRASPRFPGQPDLRLAFDETDLPDNVGDRYGVRLSGYLRAPATGEYRFNVTGDDQHELRLSTDTSAANLVRIAHAVHWSRPTEHDRRPTATSAPVSLTEDRLYYFEALAKERHGGDHLQVYWQPPGASAWATIPSGQLVFPIPGCPTEICGNGIDDDGDGVVDCPTVSGRVFEDLNYGGGPGRTYAEADASAQGSGWAAGAIGLSGVRVDIHEQAGTFVKTVLTDAAGVYGAELPAGDYEARVQLASITSNRASNGTGEVAVPVPTFRRAGVNDLRGVVGEPMVSRFTMGASGDVTTQDFGVSYNVVTNTLDSGPGSLRQWLLNANELANDKLDLEDSPTGRPAFAKRVGYDVSVFELAGAPPYTFTVASPLPALTDDRTIFTGYTERSARMGTCGSRVLTVELTNGGGSADGVRLTTDGVDVSGLSITGFVRGIEGLTTGLTGYHIWGNNIGIRPDGTTVGANASSGIYIAGATGGVIGTDGDGVDDEYEGNLVSGNSEGITLRGTSGNLVAGNCVGTDASGTQARPNQYSGIHLRDISTGRNVVGFDESRAALTADAARNLIAGNGNDGVRLSNASDQRVSGNYIGTDVTGVTALRNGGYGIQLVGACSRNLIGTDADGRRDAAERNVVSGNRSGFRMAGSVTGADNRIAGNYFGVDAGGNTALPNEVNALNFEGDATATIVGTDGDGVRDATERNVISGNGEDGIRIISDDVRVSGNFIGVGADGTTALGNGKRGIFLDGDAADNCFGYCPGMSNGDASVAGNRIAYNDGVGLALSTTNVSRRNRISRNSFYDNGSIAIDLGYDVVTPNDPGDADVGPNTLINFPVVTYARVVGTKLQVRGFAPAGADVELFLSDGGVNPSPLPSDYTSSFGEGERYVATVREGGAGDQAAGTDVYADDGTGATSAKTAQRFGFEVTAPGWLTSLGTGQELTATATDATGNTSEFGPRVELDFGEICDNSVDDDGDGLIDCEDEDCPKGNAVRGVNQ